MSVITSPMPRMRLAMRSGWNGSNSSSFSPVPAKRIGLPTTSFTDSAAPPRASPSILVRMTPSRPTASWNASATLTASCPVIASTTSSVLCGCTASSDVAQLVHQLGVDLQPARGVDDHDVAAEPLASSIAPRATVDRIGWLPSRTARRRGPRARAAARPRRGVASRRRRATAAGPATSAAARACPRRSSSRSPAGRRASRPSAASGSS